MYSLSLHDALPICLPQCQPEAYSPTEVTMPIRFPARLGFLLAGYTLLLSCSDAATGPAGGLALVGSVPSRANPGWPLKDPVVVRLTDEDGEPRAGVPVTWLITEGGGSIEPVAAETDSDGRASAVWTLGAESGQNGLVVGIAEGSTVTAEVTAEAFRVDRLASSSRMACGLVDGAIWCWGDDAWIGTEH